MTELTQHNASEDTIFIHDLIEQTRKDDKEFKKFIDQHLFPQKSKSSIKAINKNIDFLKGMNATQQALVKSRAKVFEETYDPSKYFPTLLAIYGLIISLYVILQESLVKNNLNEIFSIDLRVIIIILLGSTASILFLITIRRRATAIYFNTLINNIFGKEK